MFEPVCESCRQEPATHVATVGGEAFDVCVGCRPRGRHVSVEPIENGRRR